MQSLYAGPYIAVDQAAARHKRLTFWQFRGCTRQCFAARAQQRQAADDRLPDEWSCRILLSYGGPAEVFKQMTERIAAISSADLNNSPVSSPVSRQRLYCSNACSKCVTKTPTASLSAASTLPGTGGEHGRQLTRYKRRTNDPLPTRALRPSPRRVSLRLNCGALTALRRNGGGA